MLESLTKLKECLQEAHDLSSVEAVLNWDQTVYMPPGGAAYRGRHMALISRIQHEKATNPEIGRLLDKLQPYAESLPYDDDDAALIRAARRSFERDTKVPNDLVSKISEHQALAYQAWGEARPENDFRKVQPYLEKTLDLSRQLADCFPGYQHIADPLIDFSDYDMKAADIREVFTELRSQLVPIIQSITAQPMADDSCLRLYYPKEQQLEFSKTIVRDFGYDFNRGRLDLTRHPFETTFAWGDVRITTRVDEYDLSNCLFSVMHESGHAMYEQGGNPAYDGTPLAGGVSSGVHESQSRTWENLVGRSHAFWEGTFPRLQATFPDQLQDVDLETFYRAVNKVKRSLIRTESDEVTYNLHPMIRFELELEMLEGRLAVKDLAEAWNDRYEQYLGITPPDDRNGVMQDVHWYGGMIGGGFQGYTLGNILSAMFFEKALKAHPEIQAEISHGKFSTLRLWLTENIYQYGSKYTAPELIQRVTGGGLDVAPLIRYLKSKYGEIYHLQ
ncbi:MAG: carboxypeptidase M32 [Anaerolineaceae bacterium]|nr:carboxypeptidase M32 [Anaerolineaceae bacterium]